MICYTNEIRLENGQIYSLDMIRLNLVFVDKIQEFVTWLSRVGFAEDNLDIVHWLSVREFSYRNMFRIITNEYSFAMAIGFNGSSDSKNNGWIEFNPNKCKGEFFDKFIMMLKDYTFTRKVSRYDLAIDIPIPRYLVRIHKDQRNYQYIKSQSSETEYLGRRNNIGFVKLYDKKVESDLDYDLTRLEITCELGNINFPTINITPLQEKFEFEDLTASDKVMIELLKQVDNPARYLGQLHYRKRKKLEPYLWSDTVQLDKDAYSKILKQVISYQCL